MILIHPVERKNYILDYWRSKKAVKFVWKAKIFIWLIFLHYWWVPNNLFSDYDYKDWQIKGTESIFWRNTCFHFFHFHIVYCMVNLFEETLLQSQDCFWKEYFRFRFKLPKKVNNLQFDKFKNVLNVLNCNLSWGIHCLSLIKLNYLI